MDINFISFLAKNGLITPFFPIIIPLKLPTPRILGTFMDISKLSDPWLLDTEESALIETRNTAKNKLQSFPLKMVIRY